MSDEAPAFALIGERLNTHREEFRVKVFERDKEYVIREARRQQRAGATHLDINARGAPRNSRRCSGCSRQFSRH